MIGGGLLSTYENTSGQSVDVGVAYDSLSVGGVMTDFSCSDQTIPDSGLGALVVSLDDWEDSGNTSVENIADMEMQLEIRAEDSYDIIDSPKVTPVSYTHLTLPTT